MVGDALKITDHLQQLGGLGAVTLADLAAAEFYQIGGENILIMIAFILLFPHFFCQRRRVIQQTGQGGFQSGNGGLRHFGSHGAAALQRQRRGSEKALVDLGKGIRGVPVGHQTMGKPLQQAGHGQQQHGAENVERRVNHGNAEKRGGCIQQDGPEQSPDQAKHHQPHGGADHIEGQVHQGGPPGILIGAHGGEHRGDTGADILAHDNGDGRPKTDLTSRSQGLQNTDGGGAGLDNGSQHGAGQHTQHRVLESNHHLPELGHLPQAGNSGGHTLHAEHQGGKAQENQAGILPPGVLAEHIKDNADQRQHRGEGAGLQKGNEKVAAVNPRKTQYPGGDGGADIGAHNHIDGLLQCHQAGIDKAHHHNRGGRGALNNRSDPQTRQQTGQLVGGQLTQQIPQPVAGPALQCLPHHIHAEKEKAKPPNQIQYVK